MSERIIEPIISKDGSIWLQVTPMEFCYLAELTHKDMITRREITQRKTQELESKSSNPTQKIIAPII